MLWVWACDCAHVVVCVLLIILYSKFELALGKYYMYVGLGF